MNSTTLNGTARDRNLNWSLQQSHSTQDGDSGGVNASYKDACQPQRRLVTISRQISQQVGYTASGGGILAHENGITPEPASITGAAILIKAPGASGVSVEKPDRRRHRLPGLYGDPQRYAVLSSDISRSTAARLPTTWIFAQQPDRHPARNAVVRAAYDA